MSSSGRAPTEACHGAHKDLLVLVLIVFELHVEIAADEATDETPQRVLDVGAVTAGQPRDEAGP